MSNKGTQTPDGNESPLDLGAVLARPVIGAPSSPVFAPETPVNDVEFEPVAEPEPSQAGQPDYEQQYDQEPQSLSPDDLAIIGVNLLDGLQSTVFALVRRNKFFDEAELEMIGSLDHSGKTVFPGRQQTGYSYGKVSQAPGGGKETAIQSRRKTAVNRCNHHLRPYYPN